MKSLVIIILSFLCLNTAFSMDHHGSPTGEYIVTHHESIINPVFGSNFNVSSSCTSTICNWEDTSTWTQGIVPDLNSRVIIDGKVRINDENAQALHVAVYPQGELYFNPNTRTKLFTGDLLVLKDGYLEIGTENQPIEEYSEIVIRDLPFSQDDVKEHLRVILNNDGKMVVHGKEKLETFIRTNQEPLSGDTQLYLEQSALDAGWEVGDAILIPHSSGCLENNVVNSCRKVDLSTTEEREITAISNDGLTLTIDSSLNHDHPGAEEPDGSMELFPHIINLERNIVFRSENPLGNRAHSLLHSRADIDIRYASFIDMGRTNTSHMGEFINIKGRYPIHLHHLIGPTTPQPSGLQFTLVGNVVDFGEDNELVNKKWGIAIHGSHYGLIERNIVYRAAGAAMVTEDSSESYNVFNKNFVVKIIQGSGAYDRDPNKANFYKDVNKYGAKASSSDFRDSSKLGRAGTGFWFNGGGLNSITNNYAADIVFGDGVIHTYGFKFDNVYNGRSIRIPSAQGNNPYDDDDNCSQGLCEVVSAYSIGITDFKDNEVYGMQGGMTYWWYCSLSSASPEDEIGCNSVFDRFTSWNTWGPTIYAYPNTNTLVKDLKVRGSVALSGRNFINYGSGFTFSDYLGKNFTISGADIYGKTKGIETPSISERWKESFFEFPEGATYTLKDSYICARQSIAKQRLHVISIGALGISSRKNYFHNISFCTGETPYTQISDTQDGQYSHISLTKNRFTSINNIARDQTYYFDYEQDGQLYDLFLVPDFQSDIYCDNLIADCSQDLNLSFPQIIGSRVYELRDNYESLTEPDLSFSYAFPDGNSELAPHKLNNIYSYPNVTYLEQYSTRGNTGFLVAAGETIPKKVEKIGSHYFVSGTVIGVTDGIFEIEEDVVDKRIAFGRNLVELGPRTYHNYSINFSLSLGTNVDSICAYYENNQGYLTAELFNSTGKLSHQHNFSRSFVTEEENIYNFSYKVDCGSSQDYLVQDIVFPVNPTLLGTDVSNVPDLGNIDPPTNEDNETENENDTTPDTNETTNTNESNTLESVESGFAYALYFGEFENLPDFSLLTPNSTNVSDDIGVDMVNSSDHFGLVFKKNIEITKEGNYTFTVVSDDGSKVYIDGDLIINNDGIHGPTTKSGSINLLPGTYSLVVEYFDNIGEEFLEVTYTTTGIGSFSIPQNGKLRESVSQTTLETQPKEESSESSSSGGGGGGGGGGGSSSSSFVRNSIFSDEKTDISCIPSFDYSKWGVCNLGKQTRERIDINSCNKNLIEERNCQNNVSEIDLLFLNSRFIELEKIKDKVYSTSFTNAQTFKSKNKYENSFLVYNEVEELDYLARLVDQDGNGTFYYSLEAVDEDLLNSETLYDNDILEKTTTQIVDEQIDEITGHKSFYLVLGVIGILLFITLVFGIHYYIKHSNKNEKMKTLSKTTTSGESANNNIRIENHNQYIKQINTYIDHHQDLSLSEIRNKLETIGWNKEILDHVFNKRK